MEEAITDQIIKTTQIQIEPQLMNEISQHHDNDIIDLKTDQLQAHEQHAISTNNASANQEIIEEKNTNQDAATTIDVN